MSEEWPYEELTSIGRVVFRSSSAACVSTMPAGSMFCSNQLMTTSHSSAPALAF